MSVDNQQAQAFLEDQLTQTARKVARLQNAADACDSSLERQGLQSRVQTIELQRDLLQTILAECASGSVISLEGIILHRLKVLQDQSGRVSRNWRRGHRTPPEYWAIETKHGNLVDLLNRYRIWRNEHSDSDGYRATDRQRQGTFVGASASQPCSTSRNAYPWCLSENGSTDAVSAEEDTRLEHTVRQVAASSGSNGAVDTAALGSGWVLLKGYFMDAAFCRQVMQQILKIPGLRGVLSHVECERS
jgi:hypothetical protein